MDFGSLLYEAHKNDKAANIEVKCYKTKFEPPKKEVKTKTNLSANIQKYLQKRDEEDKRKAEEENRKKEELLALRSQDRKSFKRVQTMLKRTKSANKSVMEDAIDDVNTAVTMAGPQQCDEDDYGYVSQEASAFYAKLMDKYTSMPAEEPKFPQGKEPVVKDLNAAKDRVKAALQKEEEEEMMPHKRKRKSKGDNLDEENKHDCDVDKKRSREPSPVDEPKKIKPKKAAPPPLDFCQLLKIAEQKQFEPIQIEKNVKEEDNERPMTKKQRIEYEREKERIERKMQRENSMKIERKKLETANRIPAASGINERKEGLSGLGRIPKKSSAVESMDKSDVRGKIIRKEPEKDKEHAVGRNQSRSNLQSKPDPSRKSSQLDSNPIRSYNQSETTRSKICQSDNNQAKTNHQSHVIKTEISNKSLKRKDSSVSDSESEKKNSASSIKAEKIYSLFEGSDEENGKYHNRRDVENKPKNCHGSERQQNSSEELKFLKLTLMPQRPVSQGRPSLLQAAAAVRAAANKAQTNSKSRDSESKLKLERSISSKTSENSSSLKQPLAPLNKSRDEDVKNKRPNVHLSSNSKPKVFPRNDLKPKQFPPKDLKPKQFPPADLKPRSFPPKDVRGRQFPPPDVKKRPNKPRRIEDSSEEEEDEYDSEMDDFIDNGTNMDYDQISHEIRNIFRYDKHKYLDDKDDECEEANFGQIDKEELRSLRIGVQEDYIELLRDEAEKKLKMERKMKMMRRNR